MIPLAILVISLSSVISHNITGYVISNNNNNDNDNNNRFV